MDGSTFRHLGGRLSAWAAPKVSHSHRPKMSSWSCATKIREI